MRPSFLSVGWDGPWPGFGIPGGGLEVRPFFVSISPICLVPVRMAGPIFHMRLRKGVAADKAAVGRASESSEGLVARPFYAYSPDLAGADPPGGYI